MTCFGQGNGRVDLKVFGGIPDLISSYDIEHQIYTIRLNGADIKFNWAFWRNDSTVTLFDLPPGEYHLEIEDKSACLETISFAIEEFHP